MTREEAVNQSIPWLQMVSECAAEQSAAEAVRLCDAVLAGVAPCMSKEGGKVYSDTRKGFLKAAGL